MVGKLSFVGPEWLQTLILGRTQDLEQTHVAGNSWHVVVCCFFFLRKFLDYQPISATSPKTNMEHKNGGWLQMIFLFKGVDFQVPVVIFRGSTSLTVLNH